MEYKEKYIKYKKKYLLVKKIQKQIGGLIKGDDILKKIKSIGFEIESSDISPIILDNTPVGLLGSKLDLERNTPVGLLGSKLDLERNTHFKPYGFNSISGSIIRMPIKQIIDKRDVDSCDILATQDSYILSQQIIIKKTGLIEDLDVGYIITDYLLNSPITTSKKNILLIEQNDDSTYGSFEFIITYRSIQSDKNLIYNKMIKIYNFLDNFVKSSTLIDDFTININGNIYTYYIYKNDNIYFMSSLPKIDLDIIQFTPQITLGINIKDINSIYEYLANDYSDFGNYSLRDELNNAEVMLSEHIFDIYINYGYISNFILLIYFFLNVDDITSYTYDDDIIGINRNTINIKIRHKFSDIFNKLSINPEYSKEFSNFIDFIQQKSVQIKIREYRINKINNLIATKIFELFTPSQRSRKFNAQIILLKNSNELWDNFTPDEIKQIKDKIKEKYPDSIFQYDNIDEILQRIINADYQFLTGNDGQNDPIVSGGTLFPYEENILIELRYIHNKNVEFQTISNTIEQLNKINLEYIEEQNPKKSYHIEDNDGSMDDDDDSM